MDELRPRAFVVMPFARKEVAPVPGAAAREPAGPARVVDFDEVYERLIAPALRAAACEPFRADREPGAGDIRTDMYFELVTADLVLADISILNANVFYELGIRHGVAARGIFMIHGGWSPRPFDVAPDRTFSYDGALFLMSVTRDAGWHQRVAAEAERLGALLAAARTADDQTVGSPVYKELKGLRPVDWSGVDTARAKYFRGALDDWRRRVRVARQNGQAGDILTLAEDAPTRLHREQLLMAAGRALMDLRRFDLASTVFRDVLTVAPGHLEAQCQLALALARLGKIAEAEGVVSRALEEHPGDPEAHGILGRVGKDTWRPRWDDCADLSERQRQAAAHAATAAEAIRSYHGAFRRNLDSYYNGINAVSLAALLGHLAAVTGEMLDPGVSDLEASAVVVRMAATNALDVARARRDPAEAAWALATLGELAIVSGQAAEARRRYREAAGNANVTYFQLDSMLSQLRLFERLDFHPDITRECIGLLEAALAQTVKPSPMLDKVLVASGHMIDAPGRAEARFPPSKEGAARDRLAKHMDAWGIGAGHLVITGGARGADILVAELARQRGARVRLLLPLPEGEFLEKSVRIPGTDWEERFMALRRHCAIALQSERLGSAPAGTSPFARNNRWCINTARVEAQPGGIHVLLVWDERSTGDGAGGTSHFAQEARRLGRLAIVNPASL